MPQFGFYPSQLFWLFISFSLLFFAMQFVLLPPIAEILKKREDKLQSILQQAEELTHQAQEIEETYQQNIDLATRKAAKKLQRVHNEISVETAQKEEELLSLLQQNIKKEQQYLKTRTTSLLKNIESTSCTFIQSLLNVFYGVCLPQKKLATQVKRNIREQKNAK